MKLIQVLLIYFLCGYESRDYSNESPLLPLRDFEDRCLRMPSNRNFHRIPGDGGYEIKIHPFDMEDKKDLERHGISGKFDFHRIYSETFIPEQKYTILIKPKKSSPLIYESIQAAYITAVPSDTLEIKEPTEGVGKFEQTNCTDQGFGNIILKSSRLSSWIEFEWDAPKSMRYPVRSGSYAQKYSECIDIRVTIVPTSKSRVFLMDGDSLKMTICPELKQAGRISTISDVSKLRRSSENKMHNDAAGSRCRNSIGENSLKDSSPCCNMAIYQIDIQSDWKRGQHFKDWPADSDNGDRAPYFSRIIGASHNGNFKMFMPGQQANLASSSLCVDEKYDELEKFFQDKSADVLTIIATGSISSASNSDSKRSALLAVNRTHNYISFLTKLVPSPDWCTGLPNVDLCMANGSWPRHKRILLHPFDFGLREGKTYIPADGATPTLRPTPVCQIYAEDNYPFTKWDPSKVENNPNRNNDPYLSKMDPYLVPIGQVNLKLIRIVNDGSCKEKMMNDEPESSINWGISKVPARHSKPVSEKNCRWSNFTKCGEVDIKDCPDRNLRSYWEQVGPVKYRKFIGTNCWGVKNKFEFLKCQLPTITHRCLPKGPNEMIEPKPVEKTEAECIQINWGSWSKCKGSESCDRPKIRSRWRKFRNETEKEICKNFSSSYEFDLCWPQFVHLEDDVQYKKSSSCSLKETQRTVCNQVYPPMYTKSCPGEHKKHFWFDKDKKLCRQIDYSLNCHVAGLQKNMDIAASANLFEDLKSCQQFCMPTETCFKDLDRGYQCINNNGIINEFRWFYNPSTNQCQKFTYLGCGGNENNFKTSFLCEKFCNSQSIEQKDFMQSDESFSSKYDSCKLSDWSEWSMCQLTYDYKCQRIRRRHLKIGRACLSPASLFETENCNFDQCKFDRAGKDLCLLTIWSQWSHCSKTCGQGIRTRKAVRKSLDTCPDVEEITCEMQECN